MKDRYIEMRNRKLLDMYFMYDYAVSKGFSLSFQDFQVGFVYMNIELLLDTLDHEFELTLLFDRQGHFIKVVN